MRAFSNANKKSQGTRREFLVVEELVFFLLSFIIILQRFIVMLDVNQEAARCGLSSIFCLSDLFLSIYPFSHFTQHNTQVKQSFSSSSRQSPNCCSATPARVQTPTHTRSRSRVQSQTQTRTRSSALTHTPSRD